MQRIWIRNKCRYFIILGVFSSLYLESINISVNTYVFVLSCLIAKTIYFNMGYQVFTRYKELIITLYILRVIFTFIHPVVKMNRENRPQQTHISILPG